MDKDKTFQPIGGCSEEKSLRSDVSQYVGASLIKQHSYSDSIPTYQFLSSVSPYLPQPQHVFLRPQLSLPESATHTFLQTPILIFPWKHIPSTHNQRNISQSPSIGENILTDSQKRALELTGVPLINYNANTYVSTNSQQKHNLSIHMVKTNTDNKQLELPFCNCCTICYPQRGKEAQHKANELNTLSKNSTKDAVKAHENQENTTFQCTPFNR